MEADLERFLVHLCTFAGILIGGTAAFYGTQLAVQFGDVKIGWMMLLMVFTVPVGAVLGGYIGYGGAKMILDP